MLPKKTVCSGLVALLEREPSLPLHRIAERSLSPTLQPQGPFTGAPRVSNPMQSLIDQRGVEGREECWKCICRIQLLFHYASLSYTASKRTKRKINIVSITAQHNMLEKCANSTKPCFTKFRADFEGSRQNKQQKTINDRF